MGVLDGLALMISGVGSMVQMIAGEINVAGQEKFFLEYVGGHVYISLGMIQIGKG
jgi:hypothetical protein